ncbi:RCC1/BLIP-II [Dendrothele bispora CBS 962.96]|uniref:RCC1/BLIP-II n=1 Tax=Dendrothele bispora (strain CBS 962.96) TaxID=1314807 RepID=A0A4S8MMB1_DENBC|nr:RCC1/BLIP-II [Dendrothele bispora CBS 962.96]
MDVGSLVNSTPSGSSTKQEEWGRVLICGGTDWTRLGRKDRPGAPKPDSEDLLEPHILRSLANVPVRSVHTSCNGCHFVVIDTGNSAWLFGRNGNCCLGVESLDSISENAPMRLRPTDLGAKKGTKFVDAACGRNHTLLVGSDGQVWSAGANSLGQCGHYPCPEISSFKLIQGLQHDGVPERAVKVSAGISFSLVLTESGKVFAFGSAEKGQLGNGSTGERITTGNKTAFDIVYEPRYIKELNFPASSEGKARDSEGKGDGKKIKMIASGQQHSAALDEDGVVYVWGYNGYCRLGLGNQVDVLRPKPVPQFTPPTSGAISIAAGPTNTVVIDKQGMYWMAGKWKNSGDGSSGSPYSTFRVMQDIMGCKILHAACGGVTHWATTPDDDGSTMTVAWGQNAANGELGLGVDEPKSSTKPTRHNPLEGIEVYQIAAGQNTTVFLAKIPFPPYTPGTPIIEPSQTDKEKMEKYSELPRHPYELDGTPELCLVCRKDNGEDDSPLECDKCDKPYHPGCLKPPLSSIPHAEWFCPECSKEPGKALAGYDAPVPPKARSSAAPSAPQQKKRKGDDMDVDKMENGADEDEDEDREDDEDMDEDDGGKKRKAPSGSRRSGGAKKKRQ